MSVRSAGRQAEELLVITKMYDLVRELTTRVRKFPRDFRFVLGDRILSGAYDILELLIEAKYTKQRRELLTRANVRLEQVRFQIRLALDEKLLAIKGYEQVARMQNEVGRLLGGWLRGSDRGTNRESSG